MFADPTTAKGKRAFDVALASVAAIPGVLLGAFLGVVIRLESRGPAVFRQERVGRDGRTFVVYKLRTMRIETGDRPSHENDGSEITRVGRWVRALKFDEIPQLANVLRGDMSLVGPRPCLPTQTDVIAHRQDLGVDRLRPGITGPSQLAGIDMSEPERLARCDAQYLDGWSPIGDVVLLVRTVLGQGSGDAATRSVTEQ